MSNNLENKALFLDRDGVVNKEKNYLYLPQDFEFFDGIFESLKNIQMLGYKIFVITNQSGIARGFYTIEDFNNLTKWMLDQFRKNGVHVSKVSFCQHGPDDECECRKPKPKMVIDAACEFDVDLSRSWFVGDKLIDMECAMNAKIPQSQTILVRSGHTFDENLVKAGFVADSIADIDKIIRC